MKTSIENREERRKRQDTITDNCLQMQCSPSSFHDILTSRTISIEIWCFTQAYTTSKSSFFFFKFIL
ncbi:Uncharacterised protein r2_g1014 [Pycnogonum litorale]